MECRVDVGVSECLFYEGCARGSTREQKFAFARVKGDVVGEGDGDGDSKQGMGEMARLLRE